MKNVSAPERRQPASRRGFIRLLAGTAAAGAASASTPPAHATPMPRSAVVEGYIDELDRLSSEPKAGPSRQQLLDWHYSKIKAILGVEDPVA